MLDILTIISYYEVRNPTFICGHVKNLYEEDFTFTPYDGNTIELNKIIQMIVASGFMFKYGQM